MILDPALFEQRDDFPDSLARVPESRARARLPPHLAADFDRVVLSHRGMLRSRVERAGERWISAWDLHAIAVWVAASRRLNVAEVEMHFAASGAAP